MDEVVFSNGVFGRIFFYHATPVLTCSFDFVLFFCTRSGTLAFSSTKSYKVYRARVHVVFCLFFLPVFVSYACVFVFSWQTLTLLLFHLVIMHPPIIIHVS